MNDFTKEEKEELEILNRLAKPILSFKSIQIMLDKKAIDLGYESHEHFLIKTGWHERFY
jgi:hypothetical protein